MGLPAQSIPLLLVLERQPTIPEDQEVVAGWGAFAIFLGMAALVALLGWSLTRQLKKTRAARDAGVFGPVENESEGPVDTEGQAEDHDSDHPHNPDGPDNPDNPDDPARP